LTKLIGVSWIAAHRMLRKLRVAMGDQNRLYRLEGIIELDDAFVGGKRPGKRGRGAGGKTAILVTCEHNNGRPGFVAMKAVDQVTQGNVKAFAQEAIAPGKPCTPMPSPRSGYSPKTTIMLPMSRHLN
jgi:hypothetical protein